MRMLDEQGNPLTVNGTNEDFTLTLANAQGVTNWADLAGDGALQPVELCGELLPALALDDGRVHEVADERDVDGERGPRRHRASLVAVVRFDRVRGPHLLEDAVAGLPDDPRLAVLDAFERQRQRGDADPVRYLEYVAVEGGLVEPARLHERGRVVHRRPDGPRVGVERPRDCDGLHTRRFRAHPQSP